MAPVPAVARALPATLLVLAAALSGCADDPAPEATPPADDTLVITRPDDFAYLNDTALADRWHLHDYWQGQTTLLIMEDSFYATVTAGTPVNRVQFRPPSGSVIPLGTSNVSVTLSWEPDPGAVFGPIKLFLKTAADDVSAEFATLENGGTVVVPSTNVQNDLPHQLLSAWSFDFYIEPDPALGFMHFDGDVFITVYAERGLDIPLYPPHVDHWKNRTAYPLLDVTQDVGHIDHPPDPNTICTGGCLPVHVPEPGLLVPYESARVVVNLTLDANHVGDIHLGYHAADAREWTVVDPTSAEGWTMTFEIEVTDAMMDGPYNEVSLWEFLGITQRTQDTGVYYGTYHITATVYRVGALPA